METRMQKVVSSNGKDLFFSHKHRLLLMDAAGRSFPLSASVDSCFSVEVAAEKINKFLRQRNEASHAEPTLRVPGTWVVEQEGGFSSSKHHRAGAAVRSASSSSTTTSTAAANHKASSQRSMDSLGQTSDLQEPLLP